MASTRLTTVKSEIHNVLSTVRLTERTGALSSRFSSELLQTDEAPIVRRLKSLHEYLLSFNDLGEVDAPTFLEPFLEIVRTPTSNSVVTGVALSSLNKLLLYGSLTAESPRSAEAVNLAVEAVCNCRFEASHHYSDEVVLLQILEVLVSLLRCPVGDRLTEDNVWSLVQVCYQMAVDPSLSELLRAAAANSLSHVVLTVFSRATELTREPESSAIDLNPEGVTDAPINVPYSFSLLTRILSFLSRLTDPAFANSLASAIQESSTAAPPGEALRAMGLQLINIALETSGETLGLHNECVQIIQNDLCKYLLLNSQTDDLPVLALTLRVVYNLFSAMRGHLKVQLEVFLTSVHFRIVDNPTASNEKKELALESLLDFCHDPSLVLDLHANYDCDVNCSNLFEQLCKLLCRHALPVSTGLTALNVLALDGVYSLAAHISARCIPRLSGTDEGIAPQENNLDSDDSEASLMGTGSRPSLLREDELILRKTHKRRLLLAASQFNKAPTKPYWKEYARELGILQHLPVATAISSGTSSLPSSPKQVNTNHFQLSIPTTPNVNGSINTGSPTLVTSENLVLSTSPVPTMETLKNREERHIEEVATFLLTTPGLDKSAIGEFLSEKDNRPVLTKYVEKFDMKGTRIDLALRRLLESFRIPGEAQKIERIMEGFSAVYYEQNEDNEFATADAVLIFAFSIIMLHTDRHSRSIPDEKRMTVDQFMRNVRGINDGKDLDPSFLAEVFQSVSEHEFMLSYDASTESAREWDVILRHSSKVDFARFSKRGHFRRAGLHEKDMFEMLFDPAVQCLDSALHTTHDGRVVLRSLNCAEDLARVATYFDRMDEFNQVLILLSRHYFNLAKRNAKHGELVESLRRQNKELETLADAEAEITALISSNQEQGNRLASPARHSTPSNLSLVESYAGDVASPIRLLLVARSTLQLARTFGGSAREGWANAVRVIASLKSEGLLPLVTKDDVALSSEDQRLLSEEKNLLESRKSRLPIALRALSPRVSTVSVGESSASAAMSSDLASSAAPLEVTKQRRSVSSLDSFSDGEDDLLTSNNQLHTSNGFDERERSIQQNNEARGGSVWSTVASFLFGGASRNKNDEEEAPDQKAQLETKRAKKACQAFFRHSGIYLELIRSTWDLSEQSLAHLFTALTSPFSSDSRPSWCQTSEFTPQMAAAFIELIVLVASANRSRLSQLSNVIDAAFAFALKSDQSDEFIVRTTIKAFFHITSLTNFEAMPQSVEALLTVADATRAGEVCRGLEDVRRMGEGDDLHVWKMWFSLLSRCIVTPKGDLGPSHELRNKQKDFAAALMLDTLQTISGEGLVTRSNAVMTLDSLAQVVQSPLAQSDDRSRAVLMVKSVMVSLFTSSAKTTPPDNEISMSTEGAMVARSDDQEGNDDAIWTMALVMVRGWWDDIDIEGEVTDTMAAILLEGLTNSMLSPEVVLRRTKIAFNKVLFPLVEDSRRRKGDAVSLLSKVFLICAGSKAPAGDEIVDDLLKPVIECMSSDFENPEAIDDSRESAVQLILNILNVVVMGSVNEEQRLKMIDKDLDLSLPSGWRDQLMRTTK